MNALRIVFLLLGVGLLGLVGWRSLPNRGDGPAPAPKPLATLAEAMRAPAGGVAVASIPAIPAPLPPDRTADVPEFSSFYGRLKSEFPRDYGAVLDRVAAAPSANAAIWDALRDLQQSKGILASQAGDTALDRFFDARSAMLDGLAPLNPHQCVDFLYGVTDASIADFTAAHRGLVATLADRTLDAIADGRGRHMARAAPSEADIQSVSSGLAALGLTPAEIGLLIDGTTPEPPLPDRRICEIGRIYLDVLHGLPADARERIYGLAAQLLARS